jgi:predicted Fe-Mo cluster-binding NifX family protein
MGARNALAEVGIELLPGVSGNADQVVNDYLAGKLN